jgi:hypothetical protein
MFKNMTRVVAGFALVAMLTGCANVMWQPIPGFIYSDVQVAHQGSGDRGTKQGTGKITSVLGWITTGDASLETIAENAGITEITHVDFSGKSYFGCWAEFTLHVYGN